MVEKKHGIAFSKSKQVHLLTCALNTPEPEEAAFLTSRCAQAEAAEAKLAAVEERDRWSEKIRELSKVQEEKDRYYAEVLELRKLKYAADRKAKGQVGVAR